MTIDYWWHARACDLDTARMHNTEIARRIRAAGKSSVGVGFRLINGRLTAVACSVAILGQKAGWRLHPISQHDAEVLTPLLARQSLWEEAISQRIAAGVLTERDLRPADARYLGAAPQEDHE